ncbi:MAG: hypothetical protein EOP11_20770 [Proteobacteria bacterium]|nr:MAG: hypothetical protein EOP11_20770 [Pseudomonadota bacterium]
MKTSLKLKLTSLGGIVVALVVTSGCMGGGGGDKAKEYAAQVCSGIARTCTDGTAAKKLDAQGCEQTCPEDKDYLEKIKLLGEDALGSATGTGTSTATTTATAAAVVCSSEVSACPDGSSVARDPENSCKFKACPAN